MKYGHQIRDRALAVSSQQSFVTKGAAYRLILSPLSPSPVSAPASHCIRTAVTSFFSLYRLFVVGLSVPFDEFPANCAGSSVCTGCA